MCTTSGCSHAELASVVLDPDRMPTVSPTEFSTDLRSTMEEVGEWQKGALPVLAKASRNTMVSSAARKKLWVCGKSK
eukprot:5687579-Amphidinium_carterae.5